MDRAAVRSLRIRLLAPLSLVGGVVAVGTLGYYWLWHGLGGAWTDALFMTMTTITTIGYGEVKPPGHVGAPLHHAPRGHRHREPLLHARRRHGVPVSRGGTARAQ